MLGLRLQNKRCLVRPVSMHRCQGSAVKSQFREEDVFMAIHVLLITEIFLFSHNGLKDTIFLDLIQVSSL